MSSAVPLSKTGEPAKSTPGVRFFWPWPTVRQILRRCRRLPSCPRAEPVKFTADMLSMGDVTVEMALNTVSPNLEDPLAALVQGLQGTWTKDGKAVTISGLQWDEADVASYLISLGTSCSNGVERGGPHLSLYEMGGDPFVSICLEVLDQGDASVALRDVATGAEVMLTR